MLQKQQTNVKTEIITHLYKQPTTPIKLEIKEKKIHLDRLQLNSMTKEDKEEGVKVSRGLTKE